MIGPDWPGPTPKARLAGSVLEVSPATIDIPRRPHDDATRSSNPALSRKTAYPRTPSTAARTAAMVSSLTKPDWPRGPPGRARQRTRTAAMIANVEPDRDSAM